MTYDELALEPVDGTSRDELTGPTAIVEYERCREPGGMDSLDSRLLRIIRALDR